MRHATLLAFLLVLPLACGDDSSGDESNNADSTSTGPSSTTPTTTVPGDSSTSTPPGTDSGSTGPDTTTSVNGTTMEDPTTGTAEGSGSSSGGDMSQLPPTNGAELLPWLEAETYTGWQSESAPHPSAGPHFEGVWTFVNDALYTSLEAGDPMHPQGAAAVKELFDGVGTRQGWAVMVKVQPDSAGGAGWYWYENYNGMVFADGTDKGLCTGCHGMGGIDLFRSPFPLQ